MDAGDPFLLSTMTSTIQLAWCDDKEDLISSAAPRTLASADRSQEKTTTEKTEPRKLGEVRFEDMF